MAELSRIGDADPDVAVLAQRLLNGDRRALARGISLVENDEAAGSLLLRTVFPHTGRARVVGVTGPPGAGKSTLVGRLVVHVRQRDSRVGVLAMDPSSPFTQGSLLGDRIRLTEHFLDPGVFIRSMATRGTLGGLSRATLSAVQLMDAAGCDEIMVETVGVGQSEIAVVNQVDTVVLVLMPGSGDSVQALKAGVMEIPDIIVINKADHPATDQLFEEIRSVLALGPPEDWRVPVVRTIAERGEGVSALLTEIDAHATYLRSAGLLQQRRQRSLRAEVIEAALTTVREQLESAADADQFFGDLLGRVFARELDPLSAARLIMLNRAPERLGEG
ncbi:MAG: methylmalonyl Co-A mutase-associated GTPase MeaB [Solirubrobacteraceae bacterium]